MPAAASEPATATKPQRVKVRTRPAQPSAVAKAAPARVDGQGLERPADWFCGARKRNGELCGLRAGFGTDHVGVGRCSRHGGSTRTHRRGASKVLATREAARLGIGTTGTTPQLVDPAAAILEALALAALDMRYWAERVAELEAGEATTALPGEPSSLYGPTYHHSGEPTGEAKRHVLVQLHEDAQRRTADIASACLRAKVAEERVRATQALAETFSDAMRAFSVAMGLSPADPKVREAMASSMRLVARTSS